MPLVPSPRRRVVKPSLTRLPDPSSAVAYTGSPACGVSLPRGGRLAIDLQKMNWKFRTGIHEPMGVSLKPHFGHNCAGGYTREHQDTGQFCDCQSLAQPVETGLH